MKNLVIIIAVFFSYNSIAQKVTWVPSSEIDEGCTMATDCETNTLCYSMEYIPEVTGVLTSYTTSFFTACIEGKANVMHNQSCVINDNSNEISSCADHNLTLLNCSGNTGQLAITKDVPVILHQICFDIDVNEEIELEVDPGMGVTMSIDLTNGFITSTPEYEDQTVNTRRDSNPCDDFQLDHEDVLDMDALDIHVFPNPSSGDVNVIFNDGGQNADLTILSADRKSMFGQRIECRKQYSFDLGKYHTGTYIVRVKGEHKTESKKFILIK